jgi:hypothetical protein
MDKELQRFLDKTVDLRRLIRKLDFVDEAVEDAVVEQPRLFLEASRYRVQKMRKRVQKTLAYESDRAVIATKLRERKDERGKRILTEGAVSDKAAQKTSVLNLRKAMEFSYVEEKFAEHMIEAFRQRRDALKIIVDARMAEVGGEIRKIKEQAGHNKMKRVQKEVRARYKRLAEGDSDESSSGNT